MTPGRCVGVLLAMAPLRGQPPDWPQGVPVEQTCHVTVTADPFELLEAMLEDPGVARAVRSGSVGNLIKVLTGWRNTDPRRLRAFLRMFSPHVPVRLGVAWDPRTTRAFTAWAHLAVAGGLLRRLPSSARDPQARAVRERLLSEAARALRAGLEASVSVWVRARTARIAERWLGELEDVADDLVREATEGLEVSSEGARLRVTFTPLASPEHERSVREIVAAELGIPAGHARLREMGKLLLGWSLRCEARVDGADLVVVLRATRQRAAPAPRPRNLLADLAPPEPSEGVLLRAAVELAPLREGLEAWITSARRWQARMARTLSAEENDELTEILELVPSLLAYLSEDRAAGWIAATNEGLSWRWKAVSSRTGRDVGAAPLLRLLPARDVASLTVDGRVDVVVAARELPWLDLVRAAARVLDANAVGERLDVAESAAGAVLGDALESRPWAKVTAVPTPVEARARSTQGVWEVLEILAGQAMIARLAPGRRGVAVARALFERLGEALGADPKEVHDALERPVELDVPAVSVPLGVLLSRPDLEFSQGLRPHAFAAQGHLVLSTSLPLSRAILAQSRREPHWRPRRHEGRTTMWSVTSWTRLADTMSGHAELFGRLRAALLDPAGDSRAAQRAVFSVLSSQAFAGLLELIGPSEQWVEERGQSVTTHGRATWWRLPDHEETAALVARARRALGATRAGVRGLLAEGDCRFDDQDGSFTFTVAADGRYLSDYALPQARRNGFDGRRAWSRTFDAPYLATPGWRDVLRGFFLVVSGGWTDPPADFTLALDPDRLPGEGPAFFLRSRDGRADMRLVLDRQTLLPAWVQLLGGSRAFPTEPPVFRLDGYVDVAGRMLPTRILEYGHDRNVLHRHDVRRWRALEQLDDRVFSPHSAPPDRARARIEGPGDVPARHVRHGPSSATIAVQARGPKGAVWLHLTQNTRFATLSPEALERLGFPRAKGPFARLPELRVGPLTLSDLPVRIAPATSSRDDDVLGELGLGALQGCGIELDVGAPSLRLLPADALDDEATHWAPLRWESNMVVLQASLGRARALPTLLEFDLHARHPPIFFRSPLLEPILSRAPIRTAGLYSARSGLLLTSLPAITLGGQRISEGRALLEWDGRRSQRQATFPLVLHMPHADERPLRVLIDLPRHRLAFAPPRPRDRGR